MRIVVKTLDTWTRYGQACVQCGRRFGYEDRPVDVAWLGVGRTSPLRACWRHHIDPTSVVAVI